MLDLWVLHNLDMQTVVSSKISQPTNSEIREENEPVLSATDSFARLLEEGTVPKVYRRYTHQDELAKERQHGVYYAHQHGHTIKLNIGIHFVEIDSSLNLDLQSAILQSDHNLQLLKQFSKTSAEFSADECLDVSPFGLSEWQGSSGSIEIVIKNYLLPGRPTVFKSTVKYLSQVIAKVPKH